MVIVENNSVGFAVLDKLIERGYPNIYFSIKSTHDYIDQIEAEYRSNSVPGFTTSSKTRPLIVAKLEEYIRNKLITVNSSRLFHEFKTFIWYFLFRLFPESWLSKIFIILRNFKWLFTRNKIFLIKKNSL